MIDDTILDCTRQYGTKQNRFFLEGEPKAIMLFEVASYVSMEDAENQETALIKRFRKHHFGYATPKLWSRY
jgi:hypothetical protein